jgi:hypothetical protein
MQPLAEFESKFDLPAQFMRTECYSSASAPLQVLMLRFAPWYYYVDSLTSSVPMRVLSVNEDETLAAACLVNINNSVYLNFATHVLPSDVLAVPEWTPDNLDRIGTAPQSLKQAFIERNAFTELANLYEHVLGQLASPGLEPGETEH